MTRRASTLTAVATAVAFAASAFLSVPQAQAAPTATKAATAVPVPSDPGTWATLNCPGFNPIHSANLDDGRILAVAGSGYNRDTFDKNTANPLLKLYKAWIYDPEVLECPSEIELPQDVDLFCAGMTHLQDGRLLFYGGTGRYGSPTSSIGSPDYYAGIKDVYLFDPATDTFAKSESMKAARWYGTGPVNSAGNPVVVGGYDENSDPTPINETYNPYTGHWTNLPSRAFPMYAGMALLPNGTFAYYGSYFGNANGQIPMTWNWQNGNASAIPGLAAQTCRDQASGVTLYPTLWLIGGGCGTSATSAVSKLNLSSPTTFTSAPALGYAAQHICTAVLPDKSVFASGGSVNNTTPRFEAKRLLFNGAAWVNMAKPTVPRQYHSTCLTTKSGKVVTMGTNYKDGTVEGRIEIYSPWYTQAGLTRPGFTPASTVTVPNGTINATYTVASISSATLTKLVSETHQLDPNGKRTIPLTTTTAGKVWGNVSIKMPAQTIAPPGVYMLSLLDWRGVPTEYKTIRIGDPAKTKLPAGAGGVSAAMPCECACC